MAEKAKNNKGLIAIICGLIIAIAAIVTTIIIVNGNNGGGNSQGQNSIVGQWKYYDPDSGTSVGFVYTFNADGTGQYDMVGAVRDFTYKIDGNKISIIYSDAPFDTEYEINGDILNIKDSGGNDTLYRKI